MKNILVRINSRLDTTEENINIRRHVKIFFLILENMVIKTTKEREREKNPKKKLNMALEACGTISSINHRYN